MSARRLTITGWIVCGGLLLTGVVFGAAATIAALLAYFVFGLISLYRWSRPLGLWAPFWRAAACALLTVGSAAGAFVCFATAFDLADDFVPVPTIVNIGLIGFAVMAVASLVLFTVFVMRAPRSSSSSAVTAE